MRPRFLSLLTGWAVLTLFTGLARPDRAEAHAGAFILAKCRTGPGNRVTLTLSVDCGQHPVLTNPDEARAAMRNVLQLQPAAPGNHPPQPLSALSPEKQAQSSTPDPDLPLPPDPGDETRVHQLETLEFSWLTDRTELNFSVPEGNPHDVLFWLAGNARPPDGPVPWRILIAGDHTPPVPLTFQSTTAPSAAQPAASESAVAAFSKNTSRPPLENSSARPLSAGSRILLAVTAIALPIILVTVLGRKSRS